MLLITTLNSERGSFHALFTSRALWHNSKRKRFSRTLKLEVFFAFFRFISAVGQLNLRFIAAGRGSWERQRLIFLHLLTKLMSSLPDVLSLEYSSYVRTSRSAHKFTRLHILVFFSFDFQLQLRRARFELRMNGARNVQPARIIN